MKAFTIFCTLLVLILLCSQSFGFQHLKDRVHKRRKASGRLSAKVKNFPDGAADAKPAAYRQHIAGVVGGGGFDAVVAACWPKPANGKNWALDTGYDAGRNLLRNGPKQNALDDAVKAFFEHYRVGGSQFADAITALNARCTAIIVPITDRAAAKAGGNHALDLYADLTRNFAQATDEQKCQVFYDLFLSYELRTIADNLPVARGNSAMRRFCHFAADPAHGGAVGSGSLLEAKTALQAIHDGLLNAQHVVRSNDEQLEFEDANAGTFWDVKTPRPVALNPRIDICAEAGHEKQVAGATRGEPRTHSIILDISYVSNAERDQMVQFYKGYLWTNPLLRVPNADAHTEAGLVTADTNRYSHVHFVSSPLRAMAHTGCKAAAKRQGANSFGLCVNGDCPAPLVQVEAAVAPACAHNCCVF